MEKQHRPETVQRREFQLDTLFKLILVNYPTCRNEMMFATSPMKTAVQKILVDKLLQTQVIEKNYTVRGSVGEQNWLTVPWVAIWDERLAATSNNDACLAYLFSQDGKNLYLVFHQSVCCFSECAQEQCVDLKQLDEKTARIRQLVSCPPGFIKGNDIVLGNPLLEKGCVFYRNYSVHYIPSQEILLEDLRTLLATYSSYVNACGVAADEDQLLTEIVALDEERVPTNSLSEGKETDELENLLGEPSLVPLLQALKQDGIDTAAKFRSHFEQTSLLRYLNERALYSWYERIGIVRAVRKVLSCEMLADAIEYEQASDDGRTAPTQQDEEDQTAVLAALNQQQQSGYSVSKPAVAGELLLDWRLDEKITYAFPTRLVLTGQENQIRNWANLLVQVCEWMVKHYPQKMQQLLTKPLYPHSSGIYFSMTRPANPKMRPVQLSNGTWLRTNYSADTILKIIRALCQHCGCSLQDVRVYYRRTTEPQKGSALPVATRPTERIAEARKSYAVSDDALDEWLEAYLKKWEVMNPASQEQILRDSANGYHPVLFPDVQAPSHPRWTQAQIKKALDENLRVIEIKKKRYVHRDKIADLDQAAPVLWRILQSQFRKFEGYSNRYVLFEAAQADVDLLLFLNDNALDEEGLYFLARHLFQKEKFANQEICFSNNLHIWEGVPDHPMTNKGLLIRLAQRSSGYLSRSETEEFLTKTKLPSYYFSYFRLESEFYLYDVDKVVLADAVPTQDADWLKTLKQALELLWRGGMEWVIPRNIELVWYDKLPELPLAMPWTPIFLQEMINALPLGYRTIRSPLNQARDTIVAGIVTTDSPLESFADLVYAYLEQQGKLPLEAEAEQLRELLGKAGMLAGNELIYNLHRALDDPRFIWSNQNQTVRVRGG